MGCRIRHRSSFAGLRRDMGATMAMIVLSSPAILAGFYFKKTGPSRFIAYFLTDLRELSKFRGARGGEGLKSPHHSTTNGHGLLGAGNGNEVGRRMNYSTVNPTMKGAVPVTVET
jgi:hypothetical protein